MNVKINSHSSIRIENLHFDPFQITEDLTPAKYVFITHPHYDHLSIDDIKKVSNKKTTIIATVDDKEQLESNFENKIIYVKPNESLTLGDIQVETFASYNLNKNFHKKEYNWVGYKVTIKGTTYAVVGDTDATPELEELMCDILLLPIGGTYTMTGAEAADLANKIKPSVVIPTHYNAIVGSKKDEAEFVKNLSPDIKYEILIN